MRVIRVRRGWWSFVATAAATAILVPVVYYVALKYKVALIKATAKHQHLQLRESSQAPRIENTNTDILTFKLDMSRPHTHPWMHSPSETCRKFATRFANASSLPIFPLASYPGSGNTWVRYLLEGLSGVFTGDIYRDRRLKRIFLGTKENYRLGTTFGAKTHRKAYEYPMKLKKGSKVLLIIRNPFEALISYYQLTVTKSHTKTVSPKKFKSERWGWFLKYAMFWSTHVQSWIKSHQSRMLVIHYEELKDNLEAGLREIQSFLNLESNSDRLKCILKARDGSYKRPTLAKKTFPFNETQVEFVVGYLKNVTTFMKQRDMKPLPLDLYMQSLRSKFTAESLGHLDLVQNCTAKT